MNTSPCNRTRPAEPRPLSCMRPHRHQAGKTSIFRTAIYPHGKGGEITVYEKEINFDIQLLGIGRTDIGFNEPGSWEHSETGPGPAGCDHLRKDAPAISTRMTCLSRHHYGHQDDHESQNDLPLGQGRNKAAVLMRAIEYRSLHQCLCLPPEAPPNGATIDQSAASELTWLPVTCSSVCATGMKTWICQAVIWLCLKTRQAHPEADR